MLVKLSDQWIRVASLLGLPSSVTDVITVSCRKDNQVALRKVVEWWFMNNANPEWDDILNIGKPSSYLLSFHQYYYLGELSEPHTSECTERILIFIFLVRSPHCSISSAMTMYACMHLFQNTKMQCTKYMCYKHFTTLIIQIIRLTLHFSIFPLNLSDRIPLSKLCTALHRSLENAAYYFRKSKCYLRVNTGS